MVLFVSAQYVQPQLLEPFNEYFEFDMPLRGREIDFNSTVQFTDYFPRFIILTIAFVMKGWRSN